MTTRDVFPQSVIAVIWDFDKTLTPDYMQSPIFEHFNVDGGRFWKEVNQLNEYYKNRGLDLVSKDTLYLNHILTYVREGLFEGLNNNLLHQLGDKIKFYDGLPDLLRYLSDAVTIDKYNRFEIHVEHYVVSTGLRKMILGSRVSPFLEQVWACEFVSDVAPPGYLEDEKRLDIALDDVSPEDVFSKSAAKEICGIGYTIDNTTKTRAIFEINKGTNKEPDIDVNAPISHADRRIPFENMIYIADGPSDVPVFSLVKKMGGKTYAVYMPGNEKELKQVDELQQNSRIHSYGEADYKNGSQANLWLLKTVKEIADKIVIIKENSLKQKVGGTPEHIT